MTVSFDDIRIVHESKFPVQEFNSFINFFQTQAKKFSDNIYLRYEVMTPHHDIQVETLTYGETDRIATNLACALHDRLHTASTIALMEDYSVTYLILMLALFKLRIPLLVVSVRNTPESVQNLLNQVNADAFVYGPLYTDVKESLQRDMPGVQSVQTPPMNFQELKSAPLHRDVDTLLDSKFTSEDLDKTNLIVHSSGTTSFPKAIRWSNRFHLYTVQSYEYNLSKQGLGHLMETGQDILIGITPLFHMFGHISNFQIAMEGASIYYLHQFPPSSKDVIRVMKKEKITRLNAPPYFINQMLHYMKETGDVQLFQNLRLILSGGAPTPNEQDAYFLKHKLNFGVLYAMSECCYMMMSDFSLNRRDSNTYFFLEDSDKQIFLEHFDGDKYQQIVRAGSPFLATGVANRPNGDFATKDLFIASKEVKGGYRYVGRADDILIMSNGEKTNPLPIEDIIKSNPLVSHCTVIGANEICTAALIQLDVEAVKQLCLDDIYESVHESVRKANKIAPQHSILLPEMVKIIPLSRQLPITDKGTVSRNRAIQAFQKEVTAMYTSLVTQQVIENDLVVSDQTIEVKVHQAVSKVLPGTLLEKELSLFKQGLDSLLAIKLRNQLSATIQSVPQDFLYRYSSLSQMIQFFEKGTTSISKEFDYAKTSDILHKYLKLAYADLEPVRMTEYGNEGEHVVLLTGATGSLGAAILLKLLNNPNIKKIYALVRGIQTNLMDRILESFQKRDYTHPDLLTRVEALPMQLNKDHLGFDPALYERLKSEVTMVQHCAWLMDFHHPVSYYDDECIRGLYHLVKFCHRTDNPIHLHFVSSVSATGAFDGNHVPELPMLSDPRVALPMGYAQSKFIVEQLFHFLVERKSMPCFIHRVSQLCGDSTTGAWNTSEMYPLTIIGGASCMKKMPSLNTVVDFLPVDMAGEAIVQIMMKTVSQTVYKAHEGIFHIVHPESRSWSETLAFINASCGPFDVVSPAVWVDTLRSSPENPAYKLLPFYENAFEKTVDIRWNTENTCNIATVLLKAPTFQDNFVQYLKYWKKVGFYKPSE